MFVALCAAVGGAFGSFFNVVVWRLPRGESVVHPGSRCPGCGRAIPFYRNIPVVSWLLQRGKCAWCARPIPLFYVLVEAFCALIGAFCGWSWAAGLWSDPVKAAGWAIFAMLSVPIALIDWEHFEIPDSLVVVSGIGAVVAAVALSPIESRAEALVDTLRDGLLAAGFLYAIHFTGRVALGTLGVFARAILVRGIRWEWRRGWRRDLLLIGLRWARFDAEMEALGLGDVSLGLAAGACLGFPAILVGLAPAAGLGALGYLFRKSHPLHKAKAEALGIDPQAIPFGPFLCAGFLLAAWVLRNGLSGLVP